MSADFSVQNLFNNDQTNANRTHQILRQRDCHELLESTSSNLFILQYAADASKLSTIQAAF